MGNGKRKIEIKPIAEKSSRNVTFTKRRQGLFKKAHHLESMSRLKVAIVVLSPAGNPYLYGDADSAIESLLKSYNSVSNASTSGCESEIFAPKKATVTEGEKKSDCSTSDGINVYPNLIGQDKIYAPDKAAVLENEQESDWFRSDVSNVEPFTSTGGSIESRDTFGLNGSNLVGGFQSGSEGIGSSIIFGDDTRSDRNDFELDYVDLGCFPFKVCQEFAQEFGFIPVNT